MLRILVFLFLCLGLLSVPPLMFIAFVAHEVFLGDRSHLSEENIVRILQQESVILYQDGVTQVGSLFGNHHRQYVKIQDVPPLVLKAIIAAEDARFYEHFGVDIYGLFRAMIRNITNPKARREGASTITNQTVKNLFGRKKTNYYTKFIEILNSLKMELMYPKDKILEFYINQFHVVGNGLGISIAAKYYFNKEVTDLTLNEAAFIAGSLKAPFHCNPFNQPTEEKRQKAIKRGFQRKNYVLKRMYENGYISKSDYEKYVKEPVPFQRGEFQFNNLTLVQMVEQQINRPEILKAVGAKSYEDLTRMGLRITTTLNPIIQNRASFHLRMALAELELMLSGYASPSVEEMQNRYHLDVDEFYVGQIASLDITERRGVVSFKHVNCLLDEKSFENWTKKLKNNPVLLARSQKNHTSVLSLWKTQVQIGDPILVSVREKNAHNQYICDIHRQPELQGSVLIVEEGKIRGLMGGFGTNGYNRAIHAKRQPGSTFKPLVFHVAGQLGWNPTDALPNFRMAYEWRGGLYYPRPDHTPQYLYTNLLGASAKSENLASVWLSLNLTRYLNETQYMKLLEHLGLYKPGRTLEETMRSLEKRFLIDLHAPHAYYSGLLDQIKEPFILASTDLNTTQKALLVAMQYGGLYRSEEKKLKLFLAHQKNPELFPVNLNEMTSDEKIQLHLPSHELETRLMINKNSLVRWLELSKRYAKDITLLEQNSPPQWDGSWYEIKCDQCSLPQLAFVDQPPLSVKAFSAFLEEPDMQPLSSEQVLAYWEQVPESFDKRHILLDGIFSVELIENLWKETQKLYNDLKESSHNIPKVLRAHQGFNFVLSLYYVTQYLKRVGIKNPIASVPSLVLGACDITPGELIMAFQSFLKGEIYQFFNPPEGPNELLLVERIETYQGDLLWEAKHRKINILPPETSASILSILRTSILSGTGQGASGVYLKNKWFQHARIPVFGKTGTTNKHTNAIFTGFLPLPTSPNSPFSANKALTISVYVGYDQNIPMVKNGIRIYGASGALPCWKRIVQDLVNRLPEFQNYEGSMNSKGQRRVEFVFPEGFSLIKAPLYSRNLYQEIWGTETSLLDENAQESAYGIAAVQKNYVKNMIVPKRPFTLFGTALTDPFDK